MDQFERENEEALFFKVKGIEQDFALLLHFLVPRQIAREHYMPSEVQDEPQHGADVDDRPDGCPRESNAQVARVPAVRAAETVRDSRRGLGGWHWAGVRMGGEWCRIEN